MDNEQAAEVIGETLAWAVGKADLPAISEVEWNDLGEVEFTDTFGGQRFRMTIEKVEA